MVSLQAPPTIRGHAPDGEYGAPAEATSIVSEEAVLAQFLVDLSVLDCGMLHVSYWTLSHSPLTLTDSHGLILTSSCEALALLGNFRPFVARDSTFTSRPFGHPTLGSYIRASSSQEIRAFMVCLLRLHAHCGCYRETAFVNAAQSGPPGPFRHPRKI